MAATTSKTKAAKAPAKKTVARKSTTTRNAKRSAAKQTAPAETGDANESMYRTLMTGPQMPDALRKATGLDQSGFDAKLDEFKRRNWIDEVHGTGEVQLNDNGWRHLNPRYPDVK